MPAAVTKCLPGFAQHCWHKLFDGTSLTQYLCCWCGQNTPTTQTVSVQHQHGSHVPPRT